MKKVQKPYKFGSFKTTADFSAAMAADGLNFPVSDDLSILMEPITLANGHVIPNRMVIQPLEGFDGTKEGNPSDLIFRRYKRYAEGGAGLIWYESITVSDDGRCNPLQMIIKKETVPEIRRLVQESDAAAIAKYGRKPYNVLQLTHSGRRSTDANWRSTPLAVVANPYIDHHNSIDGQSGKITFATDEKIEEIIEGFIRGAELAVECGFDSVDVKVCHEYILRELLAAYNRPGKYGGSFENRTRAVFDIIHGIKARCGDKIDICVRLNAYDCIPWPHGWGMKQVDGVMEPDPAEVIQLCNMLVAEGVDMINLSTMLPRYQPTGRGYLAELEEDAVIEPYKGEFALLDMTRRIKEAVPGGTFVCTGLSWFENFGANVAAGGIKEGWFDLAGFGRQAFAYPDFAEDIMKNGGMVRSKCCICCDKCYDLIQKGHVQSGCVVRDQEVYLPLYRKYVMKQDV
ncbi:MAG: NADH:flavin oxidoreductase [Candidatus Pelethousia sp.]|nr:NADH:flavin oxidoreductase [Candidatus Pelethousia sp.]